VADSLVEAGGQPDAIGQLPTSIRQESANWPAHQQSSSTYKCSWSCRLPAGAPDASLANELGALIRTAIAEFQHLLAARCQHGSARKVLR